MGIPDNVVGTVAELASDPASNGRNKFSHYLLVYETTAFLAQIVSRFVGDGLEAGEGVIVVATKPHCDALEEQLRARVSDMDAALEGGQFLCLEASGVLEKFQADGWPDSEQFTKLMGELLRKVSAAGKVPRIRIFGELVSLPLETEQQAAAIRLEELWNDLAKSYAFTLLCAYPRNGFRDDVQAEAFLKVCAEHSHVLPAESCMRLASEDELLKTIVQPPAKPDC